MAGANWVSCPGGQRLQLVQDGPICCEEYRASKVRVVHILKEATKSEGLGPALLSHIRPDGTVKWRLWKVTARRSYALQNGLPDWSSLCDTAMGAAFRASAIINLNDTIPLGEESRFATNTDAFVAIAKQRWPNRKQQLEALKPSIIVCGGTYDLICRLLAQDEPRCVQHEGFLFWKGIPFIRAFHPSFRGKRHVVEYAAFRDLCLKVHKTIQHGR